MVNKPGRIGRDGEHKAVEYLIEAGFEDAEREGKRAASLDIIAEELSIPVEVKRQKNVSFPAWMRKMEERHGDKWAHFIIQRDARRAEYPDSIVFPAAFGSKLLFEYETEPDYEAAQELLDTIIDNLLPFGLGGMAIDAKAIVDTALRKELA